MSTFDNPFFSLQLQTIMNWNSNVYATISRPPFSASVRLEGDELLFFEDEKKTLEYKIC